LMVLKGKPLLETNIRLSYYNKTEFLEAEAFLEVFALCRFVFYFVRSLSFLFIRRGSCRKRRKVHP